MKAEIERISPVECRVRVEIPWEEVSGRLNTKLRELRGRARIPGFRPGKVPPHLVERMFGRGVRQELSRDLVQETFQTAVAQNDTIPLTQPVLESSSLEKGEPFRYQARFEVPPQIEPKDYAGVPVGRRLARIDEEKVEAELKRRQEALAELLPIEEGGDEPTRAGDVWAVDVDGTLGDTKLSRKDIRIEIGAEEGELIPGLASSLAGTKRSEVGTVKEVTFTPTADRVRPEFKDKQAVLTLGLRDVRLKHVPERDDDFARDTGEAETLAELEEKIRKSVLEADQGEAEIDARRSLVATLLERNAVDPAPSMIAREVQAQVDATKQQLAAQGLDLSKVGSSEAELAQRIRPQALFNVRAFLLLDAIGKAERIDVSDEDLEAELKEMAEEKGQNLARMRATMEKDGQLLMLRAQLREERILNFLMDKAKITEGDVEPPEVAEEGEPAAKADDAEDDEKKPKTKKKAAKKKAAKKTAKKKTAKKKATKKAAAEKASEKGAEAEEPAEAAAKSASGKKTAKKKTGQSRRRRRKTADS
jgi:trigger factor